MSLRDSFKKAVHAVTGGGAKVTFVWEPEIMRAGEPVAITVTVASRGETIKSDGLFLDFYGARYVMAPDEKTETPMLAPDAGDIPGEMMPEEDAEGAQPVLEEIYREVFRLSDAFVLADGEVKIIRGTIQLPEELCSSAEVAEEGYRYFARARMEAFGNDPDSGYVEVAVAGQPPPASEA